MLSCYSNSSSKVRLGGNAHMTKTVQIARLGMCKVANNVSPMKWSWLRFADKQRLLFKKTVLTAHDVQLGNPAA